MATINEARRQRIEDLLGQAAAEMKATGTARASKKARFGFGNKE